MLDEIAQRAARTARDFVPKTPAKAFWSGAKFAGYGALAGAGVLAYQIANSQKGEMVSTLAGNGVALVTYPALAGTIAAGGAMAAAALGIPAVGVGLFAGAAAIYPEVWMGTQIARGIRTLTREGLHLRNLEFGAGYIDTQTNQALRHQALYEMSGASSAARRYLGQEARLMHR